MNNNRPLLSIVIPTKNRYPYLFLCIDSLRNLKLISQEIEIIIHDNTLDNSEYINSIYNNLEEVKYFHSNQSLSVVDNSNLSILKSSGEYVCFIGDDDGVLPAIVDVVNYMKANSIDALISSPVIYNWPDFKDDSIYQLSGAVQYKNGTGKYIEVDPTKEIDRCIKTGLRDLCRLPKVYQGIVKRETLDKVYKRTGTFFPGGSPDMANSIALALLNPKVIYYDCPLIISGQCKSVGGGERLLKRNNLPHITDVVFLPKDISENWDERLPKYWCADTIWPQSAISAFKKMGEELPVINFNQIMATFIFDHPAYYKECKSYITNKHSFAYYILKNLLVKGFRHVSWRLSYYLSRRKSRGGVSIKRDLNTIEDTIDFLNSI